jgi:hypothetical protein
MASRFRIVMHENSENLHLRLVGAFDGSSAFQLLEVLKVVPVETTPLQG